MGSVLTIKVEITCKMYDSSSNLRTHPGTQAYPDVSSIARDRSILHSAKHEKLTQRPQLTEPLALADLRYC